MIQLGRFLPKQNWFWKVLWHSSVWIWRQILSVSMYNGSQAWQDDSKGQETRATILSIQISTIWPIQVSWEDSASCQCSLWNHFQLIILGDSLPDIEDNHAGGRDVEVENGWDHLRSNEITWSNVSKFNLNTETWVRSVINFSKNFLTQPLPTSFGPNVHFCEYLEGHIGRKFHFANIFLEKNRII